MTSTAGRAGHAAGDAARDTTGNRYVRLLGRIGLIAYGLVHFTIAYLATRLTDRADRSRVAWPTRQIRGSRREGELVPHVAHAGGRPCDPLGLAALVP
ncbi:hypothetical protein Vau01_019880 [Virgisporangium aurantiacum]|uniref:DUF1206 domain-containing protein n=1 Tax=Virgisporangium aurantiacum TaxID=175570 RepID=A0A8J3Z177_9ACTN|nr:hypothetical protein Vau01_019880 [Virgisporangium aurantiacum]